MQHYNSSRNKIFIGSPLHFPETHSNHLLCGSLRAHYIENLTISHHIQIRLFAIQPQTEQSYQNSCDFYVINLLEPSVLPWDTCREALTGVVSKPPTCWNFGWNLFLRIHSQHCSTKLSIMPFTGYQSTLAYEWNHTGGPLWSPCLLLYEIVLSGHIYYSFAHKGHCRTMTSSD